MLLPSVLSYLKNKLLANKKIMPSESLPCIISLLVIRFVNNSLNFTKKKQGNFPMPPAHLDKQESDLQKKKKFEALVLDS